MIRFATIGTNFITDTFLAAAGQVDGLVYAAAYSRQEEKAVQYAARHGAERTCVSLEELAAADDVDAVYIASPNSLHYEQAYLMLSHGKHVLCEKTVTSNLDELKELLRLAEARGLVFLEAMRPVFTPSFGVIRDNLDKLGTVRRATFQYCQYSSRYDKFKAGVVENAFNPSFSNGALMDIGVYCVHPLVKLFGRPGRILADAVRLSNGVDGAGTILASYEGMQAELIYSKISNSRLPSQIQGEEGCMLIEEIPNPHRVTIIYKDGRKEALLDGSGDGDMVYEILEWKRLIEAGESAWVHNQYSLMELEVMDEARLQMGLVFPADRSQYMK